nr:FtsX-like permease family protein [Fusibacter paucivorans]
MLRKMLRDMLENKLAYLACIIVMSMGLMTYSAMSIVMVNLNNARDTFYEDYNIADAFANVQSMPLNRIDDLESIPGIKSARGILKQDVRVDFEGDENVYLRLNTYAIDDSARINDVYLSEGYELDENSLLIWIGDKFFDENGLQIDDTIDLVVNGKVTTFTIAGRVLSPEYVYVTRNSYDFMPSPKTFDIAYISKPVMEKLVGRSNEVNYINLTFEDGTVYDDVREQLKSNLKSYGLISLTDLEHQSSNAFLKEELKGLESMAKSMPFLFLGISSFILYIMLKRLTETQRGQIGILKALGYHNYEVQAHYLSYALVIGIIGGITGGILGTQLSVFYTETYKEFFSFPDIENAFTYKFTFYGLMISVVFSLFAGYQGTKKILRLTPSMAMSPKAPKIAKRSVLEGIKPFWNSLTMQGKMAVRNLVRSKGRSIFTVLGLLFAFSIMVVAWSYDTLIDTMIFDQFDKVQLYDMKVTFKGLIPAKEAQSLLYNLEGVSYVETMVEVPVQIKKGIYEKNTIIMGLSDDIELYRVLDADQRTVDLSEDGLYLSENLAVQMDVDVGDILRVETPFVDDYITMEVIGIIPQYIGSNGYANMQYLEAKTGYENVATTAYLKVSPEKSDAIRHELEDAENVGTIEVEAQTLKKYRDLLDSYGYMSYIMAMISIVVGFAIVYNSSVISLSERQRELASLRVLGMSIDEVLQIVSFEQWILGFVAIILGIPTAILMMQGMSSAYQTDIYAMPSSIGNFAFVLSVLGTALFIWLSQLNVKRKIKRLDIVEVLKERE